MAFSIEIKRGAGKDDRLGLRVDLGHFPDALRVDAVKARGLIAEHNQGASGSLGTNYFMQKNDAIVSVNGVSRKASILAVLRTACEMRLVVRRAVVAECKRQTARKGGRSRSSKGPDLKGESWAERFATC